MSRDKQDVENDASEIVRLIHETMLINLRRERWYAERPWLPPHEVIVGFAASFVVIGVAVGFVILLTHLGGKTSAIECPAQALASSALHRWEERPVYAHTDRESPHSREIGKAQSRELDETSYLFNTRH